MSKGLFSSSLLNKLGGLGSFSRSDYKGSNDLTSKFAICASKLKAAIQSKISAMDEFVLTLTQDAELMCDEYIESKVISYDQDDFSTSAVEISESLANSIKDSLDYSLEASTATGSDVVNHVLHIVDDAGRDLVIATDDISNAISDEIEVIVATTKKVEDRTDALIYKEKSTNKIMFNNLVRPSNYVNSTGTNDSLTLNDCLSWVATKYSARIDGQNLLSMLRSMCASKGLLVEEGDTLLTLLSRFSAHVGLVDIDDFIDLFEYVRSQVQFLSKPACIFDFVKSIADSSTLNEMCSDLIDSFTGGVSNVSDLDVMVSDYIKVNKGCASAWTTIRKSYVYGGALGALNAIFNFFKGSSQQKVVDENRVLQFTDNNSLVPQQFITGMLSTVGELIGQAASAALAVVQPALGIIASLATGLITTFIKGLRYQYLQTNCSILDDVSVLCDAAPYAAFETTIEYVPGNNIPVDLISLLTDSVPFQLLEFPGGFLIVGFGGALYDENHIATKYYLKCEFHPAYTPDGVVFFRRLYDKAVYFGALVPTLEEVRSTATGQVTNYIARYFVGSFPDSSRQYASWVEKWSLALHACMDFNLKDVKLGDFSVYTGSVNNEDSGYCSDSTQLTIMQRLHCNLLMFLLYVGYMVYGPVYIVNMWTSWGHWLAHQESIENNFWTVNARVDTINTSIIYYRPSRFETYDLVDACLNAMISVSPWMPFYQPVKEIWEYIQPINFNYSTWTEIITFASEIRTNNWYGSGSVYNPELADILSAQCWIGYPTAGNSSFSFGLQLPTIAKENFWRNFAITAVITGLAAGAAVATTILIKKKISSAKYKRANAVEKANDNYKANPSPENLKAYRKAVKKNNRFTAIFGGTKYSYSDYWNGASDQDAPSSENTGEILSKTACESEETIDKDLMTAGSTDNLLYKLIAGFTPNIE